jgi:tetratricopeptide (TPR) repeat protein
MIEDPILYDRNRADDLMKTGRPAEAVPIYRHLAETRPDEDSHLLALAWALHDSGERTEAAACFEELFQKELTRKLFSGFAYDELVRIYREESNSKALVSVCERAAAAQPGDVGILQTLGEAYLSAGRAADAADVFEKLVEAGSDAPEYHCLLGDAALSAGDFIRAEAEYQKAVQFDPSGEIAFLSRLADGLLRVGAVQRAKAAWERCVELRPDEPFYRMAIGDCMIKLGLPDAAVDVYTKAAEFQLTASGPSWHRLGNLFTKKGLHAHAAEAHTKAVSLEPENPLYILHLAASYAALGRNDLAADTLNRAEKLNPSLTLSPS